MLSLSGLRKEYDELINEHNETHKTTEFLKKKIDSLKDEIKIKEEYVKKTSYSLLLKHYDSVLELFPEHTDDGCSDADPHNEATCERCSIIFLKSHIEKEIANFYMM